MKICLLLSRIANGGLERVQINLANQFLSAGHEVDFVTGMTCDSPYPALDADIPVIEIAPRGPWSFAAGLAAYMRRSKPDCILTTSNDIACIALFLRPILAPRVRIIVTQHLSLAAPLEHVSGVPRVKRLLLYRAMRILLPFADARISVSEGVASDMAQTISVAKETIEVIYNPIVTSDFATKRSEHVPWPWPKDLVPTIVYVGRLAIEKRLDVLISATLPILESGQARLLIVGNGPQAAWIDEKIDALGLRSVSTCTGFVHNVLPYIAQSDVLVLPSDYEGFGNVLVEALACGIQTVSTDCPHGPREILADGEFGQLVPVGDPASMRQAILNSIQAKFHVDREKLIRRSADFSTQKAASSYLRIIEGLGSMKAAS